MLPVIEDENIQNDDDCINNATKENCETLVPLLQKFHCCENVNNKDKE
jgi:hypothetical protein